MQSLQKIEFKLVGIDVFLGFINYFNHRWCTLGILADTVPDFIDKFLFFWIYVSFFYLILTWLCLGTARFFCHGRKLCTGAFRLNFFLNFSDFVNLFLFINHNSPLEPVLHGTIDSKYLVCLDTPFILRFLFLFGEFFVVLTYFFIEEAWIYSEVFCPLLSFRTDTRVPEFRIFILFIDLFLDSSIDLFRPLVISDRLYGTLINHEEFNEVFDHINHLFVVH